MNQKSKTGIDKSREQYLEGMRLIISQASQLVPELERVMDGCFSCDYASPAERLERYREGMKGLVHCSVSCSYLHQIVTHLLSGFGACMVADGCTQDGLMKAFDEAEEYSRPILHRFMDISEAISLHDIPLEVAECMVDVTPKKEPKKKGANHGSQKS